MSVTVDDISAGRFAEVRNGTKEINESEGRWMTGSEMRGRMFTMLTVLLLLLALVILRAEMMRASHGTGGISPAFHAKRGGQVSNEMDAGNRGRTRGNHQTIRRLLEREYTF